MKKFVKPLVVAASVAAIAGIGAVSFAKWTSSASKTVTGATASLTVSGLGNVVAPTVTLLPYDQPDSDKVTGSKEKMWTIAIPTIDNAAGKITVTGSISAADSKTLNAHTKVFVATGTSAPATTGISYNASSGFSYSGSDWKELNNDADTTNDLEITVTSSTSSYNLYVILLSEGADVVAQNDMGATISISLAFTAS